MSFARKIIPAVVLSLAALQAQAVGPLVEYSITALDTTTEADNGMKHSAISKLSSKACGSYTIDHVNNTNTWATINFMSDGTFQLGIDDGKDTTINTTILSGEHTPVTADYNDSLGLNESTTYMLIPNGDLILGSGGQGSLDSFMDSLLFTACENSGKPVYGEVIGSMRIASAYATINWITGASEVTVVANMLTMLNGGELTPKLPPAAKFTFVLKGNYYCGSIC